VAFLGRERSQRVRRDTHQGIQQSVAVGFKFGYSLSVRSQGFQPSLDGLNYFLAQVF
jgi:hypothetical protein